MSEVGNEIRHGLLADRSDDDGDGRSGGSNRPCGARCGGPEHIGLRCDELGRQGRQALEFIVGEAELEPDILPIDVAEFGQSPEQTIQAVGGRLDVVRSARIEERNLR
jgi:hypothetical protein